MPRPSHLLLVVLVLYLARASWAARSCINESICNCQSIGGKWLQPPNAPQPTCRWFMRYQGRRVRQVASSNQQHHEPLFLVVHRPPEVCRCVSARKLHPQQQLPPVDNAPWPALDRVVVLQCETQPPCAVWRSLCTCHGPTHWPPAQPSDHGVPRRCRRPHTPPGGPVCPTPAAGAHTSQPATNKPCAPRGRVVLLCYAHTPFDQAACSSS
jgi:hypothetical protein